MGVRELGGAVFGAALFLENRTSVLWWENPYVWAVLFAVVATLVDWFLKRVNCG